MTVVLGVPCRGVEGPNTAIVEGVNTFTPWLTAASSTISAPRAFTRMASCGLRSPTADSREARCTTVLMRCSTMSRDREGASVTSRYANGPAACMAGVGILMSVATTASAP